MILTLEENVARGGFGEAVAALLQRHGIKTPMIIGALKNEFIEHGDVKTLRSLYGLDAESLMERIKREY